MAEDCQNHGDTSSTRASGDKSKLPSYFKQADVIGKFDGN